VRYDDHVRASPEFGEEAPPEPVRVSDHVLAPTDEAVRITAIDRPHPARPELVDPLAEVTLHERGPRLVDPQVEDDRHAYASYRPASAHFRTRNEGAGRSRLPRPR
jgi:hypothetical protein